MRSSRVAKVTAKFRVFGRQLLPWDFFLFLSVTRTDQERLSNVSTGFSNQPSGFYLAIWRMRLPFPSSILSSEFRKGVLLNMTDSILETISSEFASAAEKVG